MSSEHSAELDIRVFAETDREDVVDIWRHCGLVVPWNNPEADIARKIADSPELFFVGKQRERPVATCMAGYDGHRGWIYYLAVIPGEQRAGIASQMMTHAESVLRGMGCPKIDLMVRNDNQRVISFYQSIGYRPDPVAVLSKRLLQDDSHDYCQRDNETDDSIQVILFDLGGVLVELGESPVPLEWLSQRRDFTLAEWFESATARAFERGQISAQQFALAFIEEFEVAASADELLQHFTQWPIGAFPGACALLEELGRDYRLAVLSNSNELHWPRIQHEFGLLDHFSEHFASHLMQCLKPEPEIFDQVINRLGVAPAQILFFDDNRANVEAAAAIGIQSVLIHGFEELRHYCRETGLLPA